MISRLKEYTGRLEAPTGARKKNTGTGRAHRRQRTPYRSPRDFRVGQSQGCERLPDPLFKGIIECRNMTLVVFNSRGRGATLHPTGGTISMDRSRLHEPALRWAACMGQLRRKEDQAGGRSSAIRLCNPPCELVVCRSITSRSCWGMVIGCPQEWHLRDERARGDRVILNQTSGALRGRCCTSRKSGICGPHSSQRPSSAGMVARTPGCS